MPDEPRGPVSVLVVEGDFDLCDAIAESLSVAGYETETAATAEAAIDRYRANGHGVDIGLTDVVLPKMSGVELVRVLSRGSPGLQALFMSGYGADILRDCGLEIADERFLAKPFTLDEFEEKVREYVPSRPTEAAMRCDAGEEHRG